MATKKRNRRLLTAAIILIVGAGLYHFVLSKILLMNSLIKILKKEALSVGKALDVKGVRKELNKLNKRELKILIGFSQAFIANKGKDTATIDLIENLKSTGIMGKLNLAPFAGVIFDV